MEPSVEELFLELLLREQELEKEELRREAREPASLAPPEERRRAGKSGTCGGRAASGAAGEGSTAPSSTSDGCVVST